MRVLKEYCPILALHSNTKDQNGCSRTRCCLFHSTYLNFPCENLALGCRFRCVSIVKMSMETLAATYSYNNNVIVPWCSVRFAAGGSDMAGGGAGRVPGPGRCPEVGFRCVLSAGASGAAEPVQEEREPEDCLHTHQTQGDTTDITIWTPNGCT